MCKVIKVWSLESVHASMYLSAGHLPLQLTMTYKVSCPEGRTKKKESFVEMEIFVSWKEEVEAEQNNNTNNNLTDTWVEGKG